MYVPHRFAPGDPTACVVCGIDGDTYDALIYLNNDPSIFDCASEQERQRNTRATIHGIASDSTGAFPITGESNDHE